MSNKRVLHSSLVPTLSALALVAAVGCDGSNASDASRSDVTSLTGSNASCGSAAFWEMAESNTVASSELITDFSIVRTYGESGVVVLANLFKVAAGPDVGPTQLRISSDETITFSVGFNSVVCRQDQDCRLPFVPEGMYDVAFRRPSGEMIYSRTQLPRETRITSPSEGAYFDKTEAVDIAWTPSSSVGTHGIALSTFGCDTEGFIDWYGDTAARVPAGYVAQCPGAFHERLTIFYVNPARVPGVAGGAFKGYSQATVHFTYLDDLVVEDYVARPLSRCELADVLATAEKGGPGTTVVAR